MSEQTNALFPDPHELQIEGLQNGDHSLSTSCGVVERPDNHCGDDLVLMVTLKEVDQFEARFKSKLVHGLVVQFRLTDLHGLYVVFEFAFLRCQRRRLRGHFRDAIRRLVQFPFGLFARPFGRFQLRSQLLDFAGQNHCTPLGRRVLLASLRRCTLFGLNRLQKTEHAVVSGK